MEDGESRGATRARVGIIPASAGHPGGGAGCHVRGDWPMAHPPQLKIEAELRKTISDIREVIACDLISLKELLPPDRGRGL